MFRPLAMFVGLRYSHAKHKNKFVSFISVASILGISLGVAVLIVVLSAMNGFEKALRDQLLSVIPHGELEMVRAVSRILIALCNKLNLIKVLLVRRLI